MAVSAKEVDDLLKPVMRRFKEEAKGVIQAARDEVANILKVDYNSPLECRPDGLPAPRLQFRWEEGDRFLCHYEMVFPLREFDIRNDPKTNVAIVQLGRTTTTGGNVEPWKREPINQRVPYRDGAHAQWDSAAFRGLPIYVIAPDGTFAEVPQDERAQAPDIGTSSLTSNKLGAE